MKRNILKIMTLCAVAVLALASCKKDNKPQGNVPENGFLATIEQPGGNGGSRTHINPENWDDGTEWPVLWTEDDQIKVANGEGTILTFGLIEGEDTQSGTFKTGQPHETFFQPSYTAIYPASEGNTVTGEGAATFTLPATQNYVANSFAEKAMPMVAYSETQDLAFKNVLGGICIPLVCDGLTVTSVVLTSAADEALWGTCTTTISTTGGAPTSTVANSETGKNSLTLDCGDGVVLDATTPTYFCFMVPPATLASGFTVAIYNGESKIYQKSTTANPNITRSVISKVNSSLQVVVAPVTVTTMAPTFITKNSALGLGCTTKKNMPTTCGILYAKASDLASPAQDLVIGGTNVTNLSATGEFNTSTGWYRFDADLTGLEEDQLYYVRAWGTNVVGTISYGNPVLFATRYDYYSDSNAGKSRSTFTVRDDGTAVRLSMGNLQYQASTNTWRFADNQFDYVGFSSIGDKGNVYEGGIKCDNDLASQDYSGWIDMYSWGTSGYNHGAINYQPWIRGEDWGYYYAYGAWDNNLDGGVGDMQGKADWGYNAISNGGNIENSGWRTLQGGTKGGHTAEWTYLFNSRTCNYRYAFVQLLVQGTSNHGVNTSTSTYGSAACGDKVYGLIIFPDDFTWPDGVRKLKKLNIETSFSNNCLCEAQWSLLERAGAIFLHESEDIVGGAGYWSSTYNLNTVSYMLMFHSNLYPATYTFRSGGGLVRLAYPVD